jgi:hypothetical protein
VLPGDELAGLRRDDDRVNAILAAMIATIQEDLQQVSPWLRWLVGARTQTELIRFSRCRPLPSSQVHAAG